MLSPERTTHDPVIALKDVHKVYGSGENAVRALAGVTLDLPRGGFTAVMGPSGSGKSTFLQCAAGLDRPTSGSVRLGGQELADLDETRLTELRRDRIGFVFQSFNLLPALTVAQNVELPLELAGRRPGPGAVTALLEHFGLRERAGHLPEQLSGGQQQRVAIARALITRPAVLFADEPTGALDSRTARDVLALLRDTSQQVGQTVVMVTHDPVAAAHAQQVLFLADGRFVGRLPHPTPAAVAERMTHLDASHGSGTDTPSPTVRTL